MITGVLLITLTGCGGKKESKAPNEYTIGEETVFAIAASDDAVNVTETSEEDSDAITYAYDGMAAPGSAIETYITQLTEMEGAFSIVDDTFHKTQAPDFQAEEGSVYLARDAAEEGKLMTLALEWSEETCRVRVEMSEGRVEEAPPGMTLMEAVDYFEQISPTSLGLEGTSMEEYSIYVLDGVVFVDERPCMQLNVYSADNPIETNELMGMYLMTGDGKHVYCVDEYRENISELKIY